MSIIKTLRGSALIATLFVTSLASASVGKVIVSVGKVEGVNPKGEVRALKRRSEIFESDVVKTYAGAKTQVRFSDGSMLALGEHSLFKVEEYEYGSGNPEKAVYNLLKGSMQTITGAIGHTTKKDYTLKTPVATIGIRGTYYQLQLTPSGGLIGGVKDGAIVVANNAGITQRIGAGEFFQMASANDDIAVLDEAPADLEVVDEASAAPTESGDDNRSESLNDGAIEVINDFEEGVEQGDSEPAPLGVITDPGSLDENAGGSSSAAEGQDAGRVPGNTGASTGGKVNLPIVGVAAPLGNAVQLAFIQKNADGKLKPSTDAFVVDAKHQVYLSNIAGVGNTPTYIEVEDRVIDNCNVCQFSSGSAVQVESGGDAAIGVNWGRWSGALVVAENGVEQNAVGPDFHYIHSDKLTPYDQLANLSGSINFGSIGGTTPTDSEGNTGTLMNMNMTVDFGAMQFTAANMQVNAGGAAYSGNLASPVDISTSLTTELILDNGRINAQFLGINPVSAPDIGIMTTYELNDSGSGRSVTGANFLRGI